jgi:ribosome assembly protein 4
VVKGQPEQLVSGSDDHTMFLWTPSASKSHVARMTGHVQLINQVCVQAVPQCRIV